MEDGRPHITVFVNGLGQSWLPYGGYHTVLGALPALLHPRPEAVAVIGLGSADTLFGIAGRPETRTIDCVEIVAPQQRTLEVLARRRVFPGLEQILVDGRGADHGRRRPRVPGPERPPLRHRSRPMPFAPPRPGPATSTRSSISRS